VSIAEKVNKVRGHRSMS